MNHRFLIVPATALLLALAGCGSSGPSTCSEVVDDVVDLIQDLIDEVEQEASNASIEDLLSLGEEALPSIERFERASEEIDARAAELGCTQDELGRLVVERSGRLTAQTPIGRLIIEGVRTGGL